MIDYTEYYQKSKKQYIKQTQIQDSVKFDLYELGVKPFPMTNEYKNDIVIPPENYLKQIENLQKEIDNRFDNPENCLFPAHIKSEEDLSLRLKNVWNLPNFESLCDNILSQLEKNIFHSHLHVMNLLIYRSLVTKNPPRSSWIWHYDNNPKEFIKLMIYLTDVTDETGPFEYIRHKDSHKAFTATKIRTGVSNWYTTPQWPEGRVPEDEIQRIQKEGYESFRVVGKKGTMLLFNANSIHRASIPTTKPRDALVLILKPSLKKLQPRINPKWTGTFEHAPIQMDPGCIKPEKSNSKSARVRGISRKIHSVFKK